MQQGEKRIFKNELYEQFARLGKAFSSPRRLEMIELLAQKAWSVDELADEANMSTANASRHLQVLRKENLVRRRKEGTYIYYTLAGEDVYAAWKAVRQLAEARLADVQRIVETFLTDRDQLQAVTGEELEQWRDNGEVVVLDVRPAEEYAAGHIPGARSIPVDELDERLDELPKDQEIVAYCRGPYCVFSDQAVDMLRDRGYKATRLTGGLPDWKSEQRSVATE